MQVREPIASQQDELLRTLQHDSFPHFAYKINPVNGLVLKVTSRLGQQVLAR